MKKMLTKRIYAISDARTRCVVLKNRADAVPGTYYTDPLLIENLSKLEALELIAELASSVATLEEIDEIDKENEAKG